MAGEEGDIASFARLQQSLLEPAGHVDHRGQIEKCRDDPSLPDRIPHSIEEISVARLEHARFRHWAGDARVVVPSAGFKRWL